MPISLSTLRRYTIPPLIGFILGTSIPIFLNDHLLETTFITGESMAPTLSPTYHATGNCDAVLWRKRNATRNIQRGDIVHFMNPLRPDGLGIKRVVGLEGDTVLLDKRRRPKDVQDGGGMSVEAKAWDAWQGRARVPKGHVWVEGDNWRNSLDSNSYGPISRSLIDGRAVAVMWPLGKFWTRPWEGFEGRTTVVERRGRPDGLPVELLEIGGPHAPP